MFGYVNVFKDELKVKDYNRFRAYYCGLCKAMGKRLTNVSRLGLSYDMTFLAILLSGIKKEEPKSENARCIAHPAVKHTYFKDAAIDYAADASAVLYYLKLKDDWNDEHSIKSLLGCLIFKRAYKKAVKKTGSMSKSIISYLDKLSRLEKDNSNDIDLCADCFAKITEILFSPSFYADNARPLKWLGYNIGRWIYVIDAYSDIEKDFKNKSFNPYIENYENTDIKKLKCELSEKLNISLTFTLENIASSFELLKIYKNREILENIIYLSLKLKQENILNTKEVQHESL